jgi:hypothetical protein
MKRFLRRCPSPSLFVSIAALVISLGGAAQAETRGPYQKYVQSTCPGSFGTCQIQFVTVATNRRLEITSVSCQIGVPQNKVVSQAFVNKTPGIFADSYAPTLLNNGLSAAFAFNAQTLIYAKAGESLSAVVIANGDVQFFGCKLAGELVTLP